ncbi:MAG TPA: lipid-A-disaccharide synthase [bacterium]|nr:lipid-A-disaccharide synthase [bacterium]HPN33907.1 lipid-A-disaccharide synthase [bacterium]
MSARIMISAGEASGDMHGGRLVAALKQLDPTAEIFGIGGDAMQAAGMSLYYHVNQLAYIGFIEVARHYFFFRRIFHHLVAEIEARKPDVLVLIDYPGFNLRLARAAKALGVRTFYYIAPQVWAWRPQRAAKMADHIDEMAVLFDFEAPFFSRHGIRTHFVGHPLLEGLQPKHTVPEFCSLHRLDLERPVVALLPGSRRQEVRSLLPAMLQAAALLRRRHPQLQFAVAQAPTISGEILREWLADYSWVTVVQDETYDLLQAAAAALVASGTATLETACFAVPFALVYKVAPLSYAIGKRVVTIPYIGLVNVVAGKKIITEFLQYQVTEKNLAAELERLLFDPQLRKRLFDELHQVKSKLGDPGASLKTARLVLRLAAGISQSE